MVEETEIKDADNQTDKNCFCYLAVYLKLA